MRSNSSVFSCETYPCNRVTGDPTASSRSTSESTPARWISRAPLQRGILLQGAGRPLPGGSSASASGNPRPERSPPRSRRMGAAFRWRSPKLRMEIPWCGRFRKTFGSLVRRGAGEIVRVEPIRNRDDRACRRTRETLHERGRPLPACSLRWPLRFGGRRASAGLPGGGELASGRPSSRRAPTGRPGRRSTVVGAFRDSACHDRRAERGHPGIHEVGLASQIRGARGRSVDPPPIPSRPKPEISTHSLADEARVGRDRTGHSSHLRSRLEAWPASSRPGVSIGCARVPAR